MPERQLITALTGTSAPLLVIDVSIAEELDFSSIFLPRPWKKTAPYVTDVYYLDPNGQHPLPALNGQEVNFELPKAATAVDDVYMRLVLPPHSIVPQGSLARYTDWVGLSYWRRMEMKYGANTSFVVEPIEEYLRIRKTLGVERLDSMRQRCYGDQTDAQLATLLEFGTTISPILAPLYLPFGDDFCQCLPIVDLSQKTRYTIHLRSLKDIIYNPQGAVITPLGTYDLTLVFNLIHTTGDETAMFIALAEEPTGISYMIHQYQRQHSEHAVLPGVGNQFIHSHLNNISRALMYINWAMIPTALINDSGFNNFFMFNPNPPLPIPPGMNPYTEIRRWRIDSSGQIVQRHVDRNYSTLYNYDRYNKGFSGEDQFDQDYAQYPHADNAASGFLDYANLTNANLEIELGTGGTGISPSNPLLAQRVTVVVTAKDYNFWFIKGGNLTRCFN